MKHIYFPLVALLLSGVNLRSQVPTPADFAGVNKAMGIELFADENLWDDEAAAIATRLGWPAESKTKSSESYRKYPGADSIVLGSRPNSLALHGSAGKPQIVTLFFANKGDVVRTYLAQQGQILPLNTDEREKLIAKTGTKVARELKASIKHDSDEIEKRLTEVLGTPKRETFGQGRELKQTVSRWDWAGHAFLLSAPADEYVELKILPVSAATADGKLEKTTDSQLRTELKSRVVTRPNGDVILSEIPMVDQGPKGYCVPANWERVLRYLGIPADLYELAMAGGTGVGGGTYVDQMAKAVNDVVVRNGRRIGTVGGKLSIRSVKKHIDDGVPVMWGIVVIESLDQQLNERSKQRQTIQDAKVWADYLKPFRREARKLDVKDAPGHVCLIIGYNPDTGEIAISDSWGPAFAERWITEEEAVAISQGEMYVISW